jgi:hypothetical protein
MKPSIHTLALGIALVTSLASLAHGGGASVSLERAKDGKYLVHSYACTGPASVSLTATAEGVVNGERKSIPLTLEPTKSPGTYRFERTWPAQGTWLVRTEMSGRLKLVSIATIAHDGRVSDTEYVAEGDGRHECDQKLAANTK